LNIFNSAFFNKIEIGIALNPFSNCFNAHFVAKVCKRRQKGFPFMPFLGVGDRTAIQLNSINFKCAEILKACSTSAEFIQANVITLLTQAMDKGVGLF
jgi:hypothetical protein